MKKISILALLISAACNNQGPASQITTQETGDCQPIEELSALDPRRPVPLQPMMAWHQKQNMQDHLAAIQKITASLSRSDWAGVSEAAEAIGTSPEMQRTCQHMGAGADGFTELALAFHQTADKIKQAASTQDAQATLQATSETLQSCVGCHAAYRQEIVSAKDWESHAGKKIQH